MTDSVSELPGRRASLYRMAERAVGGDLRSYLEQQRSDGLSFERIAADLAAKNVEMSREVVRSWARDLGLSTERPPRAEEAS